MAQLVSDQGMALEIHYREMDSENWLLYDVRFSMDGKNLINEELLKKDPAYWADRREGAFRVNESGGCGLIPVINHVLNTGKAVAWRPTEPDITLGFYPGEFFPFLPWPGSAGHRRWREERQERSERLGWKMPTTKYYHVIAMIDAYNFGETHAYNGPGIGLFLAASEEELIQFRDDLVQELNALDQSGHLVELTDMDGNPAFGLESDS